MKTKFGVLILGLSLLVSNVDSFAAFSKKEIKKADSTTVAEPSMASIPEGMKAFNSLSKREKRSLIKEMKKAISEYKAQKKQGADVSTNTLLLIIIGILIPPLAVYLHEGEINNRFWISVLLTILGYILFGFAGIFFLGSLPGIIYALYVILSGT